MNVVCHRYEVIDMKTNGYLGEVIDSAYVLGKDLGFFVGVFK